MSTGECAFGHRIRTDAFTPINVRRLGPNGETLWDRRTGEVVDEVIQLPVHIVHESGFDPTGLVPALCEHGLSQHPLGLPLRHGRSWVRSRYVNGDGTRGTIGHCVVCLGEPQPVDLT